jgi:hypothetical protein
MQQPLHEAVQHIVSDRDTEDINYQSTIVWRPLFTVVILIRYFEGVIIFKVAWYTVLICMWGLRLML